MGVIQDAKNSFRNIRARKLRSFLTMLGIIIGISAVIIIMAVGAGAQSLIINQIKNSGSNLIGILPGAADENGPPASALGIKVTTLTLEDGDALRNIDHVVAVAPYVKGVATAQWQGQDVSANFTGTTAIFLEVEKNDVAVGRFFDFGEDREITRVAVLGSQVAEDLFDGSDPVGQEIKIKRETFRVIGVMKEKGTSFFVNQDNQIFVPIKAAQKLLLGINHTNFIRAKVDDVKNLSQAQEEVKSILRERHDIT
ncbi:MAG: ABC transporter permease, partial [Patescibacteria group bacterium]|nr:ABC transporter permease [Patescibacteria group bacterium]